MESRIQPHRAVNWSSSVITEPADSTFNQNFGLNLSTKTIESEDTYVEEEEKNGAEQRQPSDMELRLKYLREQRELDEARRRDDREREKERMREEAKGQEKIWIEVPTDTSTIEYPTTKPTIPAF